MKLCGSYVNLLVKEVGKRFLLMDTPCPSTKEILERVVWSLVELLQEEYLLIENDVHERTITCRLAHRLSKEFPHHHVDVEYNRYFSQPKKLSGRRIFPDIVVHKRNEQNANILAIEIKKNKNNVPNRERERLIFFYETDFKIQYPLLRGPIPKLQYWQKKSKFDTSH